MKAIQLLRLLENYKLINFSDDQEVISLCHDSRTIKPGALFFAIAGTRADGMDFVGEAITKGAVCIVTKSLVITNVPQIIVPNVRLAMSLIAKTFYNNAADVLEIIAVTGTNGKTTCTYMLNHIFKNSKAYASTKIGVIGTLGVQIGEEKLAGELTTPDPIELHNIFAKMKDAGVKTVIMEASAHAIALYKLAGIKFRAAIFTNISQDHLDFFGTLSKYRNTKISFFDDNVQSAIVNIDDEAGRMIAERKKNYITYSCEQAAFRVSEIQLYENKSNFNITHKGNIYKIQLSLVAKFNVYNALACIAAAKTLGISFADIKKALKTCPQIPGRFNAYNISKKDGKITVIIDFAHTPDSLDKAIISSKEILAAKNSLKSVSLITVMGCGGNRDTAKRPLMGEAAAKSDLVIITSDNPRYEEPIAIMKQIEVGAKKAGGNYAMIENRAEAIQYALDTAKSGDIVLIAGKGGENYTEIMGKRIEYSDEKVIIDYETTHTSG